MQPIVVALALMRGAAQEIPLTEGRMLPARVLERGPNGMGIIDLSGAVLTAKLPEELEAGDRLRLMVKEATSDQLLLQVVPRALSPYAAQAPAPAEVPLPGDGRLQVVERDGGGEGEEGPAAVTLRVELPVLGVVELRVALDASGIAADLALGDGPPLERGEAALPALREAITTATRLPARVSARRRRDPVDVYV